MTIAITSTSTITITICSTIIAITMITILIPDRGAREVQRHHGPAHLPDRLRPELRAVDAPKCGALGERRGLGCAQTRSKH